MPLLNNNADRACGFAVAQQLRNQLVGLVHGTYAADSASEASLYDVSRRAVSGSTIPVRTAMKKSRETAVVSTCLKATQWNNCRVTGSMVSYDSAVLQGNNQDNNVDARRNGSSTPGGRDFINIGPEGTVKGIATGGFLQ